MTAHRQGYLFRIANNNLITSNRVRRCREYAFDMYADKYICPVFPELRLDVLMHDAHHSTVWTFIHMNQSKERCICSVVRHRPFAAIFGVLDLIFFRERHNGRYSGLFEQLADIRSTSVLTALGCFDRECRLYADCGHRRFCNLCTETV
jgi:hypothetical protein